jgi:hypothetical protein
MESGLVAYWQFDEGSGTTAADSIGLHHGTLQNGPAYVPSTVPLGSGTSAFVSGFQTGTMGLGAVSLTMSTPFTNPVDLTVTEISHAPSTVPEGFTGVTGQRYFVIEAFGNPGSFSADVTFTFGPGVLDPRVDGAPEAMILWYRSSTSDSAWTVVGTASSASAGSGEVTFTGVTEFSQFAVVQNEVALAVELTNFSASSNRLNAELKWTTATEIDNARFEVERSVGASKKDAGVDGTADASRPPVRWQRVGTVDGHGTSNTSHDYDFTDRCTSAGMYSYRLKQVDRDGHFKYSQALAVEVGRAPLKFELSQNYPNPFNPATRLEFTLQKDGMTTLVIYNTIGQEVATLVNEMRKAGEYHQVIFDGSRLATGMYIARLQSGNQMQVKKLLLLK